MVYAKDDPLREEVYCHGCLQKILKWDAYVSKNLKMTDKRAFMDVYYYWECEKCWENKDAD